MADRLQIKRDDAAVWTSVNPVLSDGEFGFERDTNQLKIGNGVFNWVDLPYIPAQSVITSLTVEVRNSTGSTIPKGAVVFLSGSTGNKPNAVLASSLSETTSSKAAGITRSDIPNNTTGIIVLEGVINLLNTNLFNEGDYLWLSDVAGGLTNVKPIPPNHAVGIGIVTRAHPTLGSIEIRIQNGFELDELHNVLISSPVLNNTLFFNSVTGLWENKHALSLFGTAGENLGGHRVIIESLGYHYYASATNPAHVNRVVGLSVGAVSNGSIVNYIKEGIITEPSWTWNTSLPVWLGDNGLLTQTPINTTGFTMIIGHPVTSTSLYVSLKTPILL